MPLAQQRLPQIPKHWIYQRCVHVHACCLVLLPCVQREFAQKHMPDYPLFKLVSKLYEVVPGVLGKTGKVGDSKKQ
jgi:hypothetical protein